MRNLQFEWKWNLNTVAMLIGFATGIWAWGAQWQELRTSVQEVAEHRGRISQLESGYAELVRMDDRYDFRLKAAEESLRTSSSGLADLKTSLNDLTSEVRVTREILQRIEQQQRTYYRHVPSSRPDTERAATESGGREPPG